MKVKLLSTIKLQFVQPFIGQIVEAEPFIGRLGLMYHITEGEFVKLGKKRAASVNDTWTFFVNEVEIIGGKDA